MASYVSLLIALNSTVMNFATPDRLDYAKETINQLMANLGGYCLFIGADAMLPYDNAMGDILRHPELQTFPRIVLNQNFANSYWGGRGPSLVLLDNEGENPPRDHKNIHNLFWDIRVSTPALVLLGGDLTNLGVPSVILLGTGFMFNMAIVSTTTNRVLYYDMYRYTFHDLKYPPAIDELFKYQFLDMGKRELDVSMLKIGLGIYGNWTHPSGPEVSWMEEIVLRLNGTFEFRRHYCRIYSTTRKACYDKFLQEKLIDVSLDGMMLDDSNRHNAGIFLDLSIPHSMTVLVPQPIPVVRPQLFGQVFQLQLWIFIALIVSSVELFVVCRSRLSSLDLTLFALHGQFPDDASDYKPWQVFSMIGFIIVVWFLTTAFSAKLCSITLNKPVHWAIHTMADLQSSDIKFKADLLQYQELQEDPRFRSKISHHDIDKFDLDGEHAYIFKSDMAVMIQSLEINYDHRNTQARYRRLETFHTDVQFRFMEDRARFLQQLMRMERLFFESGIWNHWNDEFRSRLNARTKPKSSQTDGKETLFEGSLTNKDLLTVWLFLGLGLTVAFFMFLVESFLYHCL